MITGRDLIIYILQNNFENEPVVNGWGFLGFWTVDKYAEYYGYGIETVKAKIEMGQIKDAVKIGETYLIPSPLYFGEGAGNENESN